MTENKRYYYLKLKDSYFNDARIVVLESVQDGILFSNILLKMYLMSLEYGGVLMIADHIPHTAETIATCTRHQVGTVERTLAIFSKLGLMEVLTDGAYYMTDIQLMIGQSSTEGERKKKARMRLQEQRLLPSAGADICPPTKADKCPPILEIDTEIESEKKIEKEREAAHTRHGPYRNVHLSEEELRGLQADYPNLWQKYVEKLSYYMESTGKEYKNHAATIRRWVAQDLEKQPNSGSRDYSVKDGETI